MMTLTETPAHDRAAWLEARRSVIGASEISALALLNRHMTAVDVWEAKVKGVAVEENDAMKWGKRFEDDILDGTEEYLGIGIRPNSELHVHPAVSYFGATPDAFAADGAVVEAKYTAQPVDGPLRAHEAQCQWQMYVCGAPRAYLAYLAPRHQFHVFVIERDEEYIETLAAIGHDFWRNHVLTGEPPAPRTVDDLDKVYPRHQDGHFVTATPEDIEVIASLTNAKQQLAYWGSVAKDAEGMLKLRIGDAEGMKIGEDVAVTWKAAKDSIAFDAKRFAAEHPTTHAAYMVPKPGSRRFLLK